MLISGKIATIGVTCSTIANGKNDISTHFDWVNSTASPTPPTTASNRLRKVMRKVKNSEPNSSGASVHSVHSTSPGRGRMYLGISYQTQMRSQNQIATSMIRIGSTHLPIFSSRSARTRRASSGSSGTAARSSMAVITRPRPHVDRANQHVRGLAAQRRVVGRRAERFVARIGCLHGNLVVDLPRPRRHDDDAVRQEDALED